MTDTPQFDPSPLIAEELAIPQSKVDATIELLTGGNTVPFIARYRKEMTGSLDEVQIRSIEERHAYLVELDKRRLAILASIEEQGKLTEELRSKIEAAATKAVLEDLYLPYKPKRRTRATIAREKGLEPLALRILEQPETGDPMTEANPFVDAEKGVDDVDAALAGARDIAAETVAEKAEVRTLVRERFASNGLLVSGLAPKKTDDSGKFKDYYDYKEPVTSIPSHRYLAVRRGEREGVLKCGISVDKDRLVGEILDQVGHRENSPFCDELAQAVQDGYKRLISTSVESDLKVDLKMNADRDAVDIFASNLRSLLLAAPLGTKSVIGVDPGLRTGCKCTSLDSTGKFTGNIVFNLVMGESSVERGKKDLLSFIQKHEPGAIAVGNGTGGREAEKFIRDCLQEAGLGDIPVVQVSESGASIYSASELAGKEFPTLDLTVRGAISIGRRLQDPLAELVKIDPKSIGVGQYQHDVHQPLLARKLDEVVESCVSNVGVELNTASAPLLSRVAGIGPAIAENVVAHRESSGAFTTRRQLLKVPKLGPRTFEQAAGFLRIRDAKNPLDGSAVHPERYKLVDRIATDMKVEVAELVGDTSLAEKIDVSRYVGDGVGEPTLRDIIDELKKPGRDPRKTFEAPAFRDDVQTMEDLNEGMELQGVVTNVTAFGAFVDVGVHQDGLVHISQLADRFVKDPAEIVSVGDKIKVRVLGVDLDRKRISLSAKSGAPAPRQPAADSDQRGRRPPRNRPKKNPHNQESNTFSYNPFADLLKK
ncbi:MAG: RNA-binding transcriptional accessory protein [Deltaproteobacteria bacterium]|nr:RNA-binding transcriptional accessory protein [Deltaproteobacteria bacterium]